MKEQTICVNRLVKSWLFLHETSENEIAIVATKNEALAGTGNEQFTF